MFVFFLIQISLLQQAKLEVIKQNFRYNERYTKVVMNVVNIEKGLLLNLTIELFQDILKEKVRFSTITEREPKFLQFLIAANIYIEMCKIIEFDCVRYSGFENKR